MFPNAPTLQDSTSSVSKRANGNSGSTPEELCGYPKHVKKINGKRNEKAHIYSKF